MNIRIAKEYIKNSVNIYLKKNEFGEYAIPVVRQRPIFLVGAPGIGKTAIMEQIAGEMGLALVAYSMTHHTRQSALGLPFITHKKYGEEEFDISEYTMSEIIASIYETMEQSGLTEGILFLDEINCVSETLAPSMLQFLQYKVFGRHQVPDGWVIVTAGNPPEYNKSVREFDVVTLDRLKVLEVEPDYRIWKEYAMQAHIHSAILNYLDLKKDHFYHMEMTTKGRSFVTARGWEDLSEILYHYEEENLKVEESLIEQYIRNPKIVKEFTAYYDLFNKYKKDYRIDEILEGNASVQALTRAKQAQFDERLSLLGMLIDRVIADMKEIVESAAFLSEVKTILLIVKQKLLESPMGIAETCQLLDSLLEEKKKKVRMLERANSLSKEDKRKGNFVLQFLSELKKEVMISQVETQDAIFALIKAIFDQKVKMMQKETILVKKEATALFQFVEEAFQEGNEMLILLTELTVNTSSAQFIATFGCEEYQQHNKELLLSERQNDIMQKIKELRKIGRAHV